MTNDFVTERFISLERIVAAKNKSLLRCIPRPVMRWFKRLIHLDEINHSIYTYRHCIGASFATAVLEKEFGASVHVTNAHYIPSSGRAMVIANHPLGGADGMALISEIGKRRSDILFPVNDILCSLPSLKPIFIPINKYGRNDSNHALLEEAFASDSCLLFFPAGMVSRQFKGGEIKDMEWKNSFIKKACEYHRDLVPVYIDARNTKFFYRFAKWRKRLGIKPNIELVLLPSEMFKQKGKTIRLIFGQPIPYHIFDNSKSPRQWTTLVRQYLYSLKNDPHAIFDPHASTQ